MSANQDEISPKPPPSAELKAEKYDNNLPTEEEFAEVLRLLANVRGKVISLQRRILINS